MSSKGAGNPGDDERAAGDQVSFTCPDSMKEIIDDRLTGTIATSRSDAVRTALAIYLTENGLMELQEGIIDE